MALNEQIVTGRSFRKCIDATNKLWQKISFWSKASDIEFDDGENAETKLGAIKGITTDLNITENGYAADMTALAQLNSEISILDKKTVFNVWGIRSSGDAYNSVKLNIELSEPSGYFSVSDNTIICKKPGIYLVSVPALFFSGAGDDIGSFTIGRGSWNTSVYCGAIASSIANLYPGFFSCSAIVSIDAGEKIITRVSSKNVGSRIGYNTNVSETVPSVFFYFLRG